VLLMMRVLSQQCDLGNHHTGMVKQEGISKILAAQYAFCSSTQHEVIAQHVHADVDFDHRQIFISSPWSHCGHLPASAPRLCDPAAPPAKASWSADQGWGSSLKADQHKHHHTASITCDVQLQCMSLCCMWTVRYRKDRMGSQHLKGKLGTNNGGGAATAAAALAAPCCTEFATDCCCMYW